MLKQNLNVLNRSQHDINWIAFEKFVRNQIEDLDQSPLEVKQFTEGYSNLTYLIKIGNWEAIMRRPPFGKIPPKAHDVEREFRLLDKLHSVFPLAPKPYLYEEDPNIMDKHFYIMEKKNGIVLDDVIPPEYQGIANIEKILSDAVVDTLVQLHDIDYKKAGLHDFGKPAGYLERQVHGWIKRYQNSKTDDIDVYPDIERWIASNIPISLSPTIVHNDYKVNNMMFSANEPGKPVGVLDWEMCTIGDPLTDLASAIAYWKDENDPYTAINSVTTNGGFISRQAFLERYANKSNRDLTNFHFYLAFAYFKIAAILQQIYYRWKEGHIVDERFSSLIEGIKNLMQFSHDVIYLRKG